ncbi:hypothetical protein [Macrococcus capreoli]|uniref:hypothetical protein n=1 Tax=Macrococcus capreoli TaxID=2982690 RepID=UPI003EE68A9C
MTSINDKVIKRYVGFDTKRDEYQLKTIHSLLARCNILTFYLIIISIWLSTFYDVYMQQLSIGTFILIAILCFIGLFNGNRAKHLIDFDNNQLREYYDQNHYKSLIHLIKLQFVHIFILIFTLDFSLSIYMDAWIDGSPLLFHWLDIVGSFIQASILTSVFYYVYKMMLEKKY